MKSKKLAFGLMIGRLKSVGNEFWRPGKLTTYQR